MAGMRTWSTGFAGIGGVTALKLIQRHECLEKVLESMKESKYQIPDPFPFDEARRLFKGASLQGFPCCSRIPLFVMLTPALKPL